LVSCQLNAQCLNIVTSRLSLLLALIVLSLSIYFFFLNYVIIVIIIIIGCLFSALFTCMKIYYTSCIIYLDSCTY
jgi:hypothetical protein